MSDEYDKIQELLREEEAKQHSSGFERISRKKELLMIAPITLLIVAVLTLLGANKYTSYSILQVAFGSALLLFGSSLSWYMWTTASSRSSIMGEANRSAWTNKSSNKNLLSFYRSLTFDGITIANIINSFILMIIIAILMNF